MPGEEDKDVWRFFFALILMIGSFPLQSQTFDHQHRRWSDLLDGAVHWQRDQVASAVDYQALLQKRPQLDAYLKQLSAVSREQFEHWSRDQQLAFLINAYNAFTIQLILDHYPVHSIREIGNFLIGPWERNFIDLLGERVDLDTIEHDWIRGWPRFAEPRIHFALNCAAVGCPALLPSAYRADRLEAQLAAAEARFLQDRQRNRYLPEQKRLEVSSIFKWYGDDFGALPAYFATHAERFTASGELPEALRAGSIKIRFLAYDWRLNEWKAPAAQ